MVNYKRENQAGKEEENRCDLHLEMVELPLEAGPGTDSQAHGASPAALHFCLSERCGSLSLGERFSLMSAQAGAGKGQEWGKRATSHLTLPRGAASGVNKLG